MENNNLIVQVEMEELDGRSHFKLNVSEKMNISLIRAILISGINLTIRGENGPEKQAQALMDVIEFMKDEFVNSDSFKDLYINKDGKISF
jgi:hypothetical protein